MEMQYGRHSPVAKSNFLAEPENCMQSCFFIDFGSPGSTLSESAGCTIVTLERFEKFKMASKMAAVSYNSL